MERVAALCLVLCLLMCGCERKAEPEVIPQADLHTHSEPEEHSTPEESKMTETDFIKWVEFNCDMDLLQKAYTIDKKTEGAISFTTLLAYSVAKNWGNVNKKCLPYVEACKSEMESGKTEVDFAKELKLFSYFKEAYQTILGEFVGEREDETYGIKAYCPIAKGFYFNHYKDFGASRTYGFSRPHKGNDLMGAVGTPIIAVEGGQVEALGWNPYGGWRIGIRSNDKKRYYYYAHLRKGHPYPKQLKEGDAVRAGDVIGYLGQTGYSSVPDRNNISVPHLHFGMQLIFDESQKDAISEIWIDVYSIVEFLSQNKSEVKYDQALGDYCRVSVP